MRQERQQLAADKENGPFATNQHSDRKMSRDYNVFHTRNEDNNSSGNSVVVEFRDAARRSASSKFWSSQSSEFIQCVLSTSQQFSLSQGAFLLHELHITLLNESRKCIKEITEQKKWNERLQSNLYVAAHGLRAAALGLDEEDQKNIDSSAKILYHSILTISERMSYITDKDAVASICISLYDCLGHLLGKIQLDGLKFTKGNSSFANFPTPTEEVQQNGKFSSISRRQLLKIGIQSILGVLNVISQTMQGIASQKASTFLKRLKCCVLSDVTDIICRTISSTFNVWVQRYASDIADKKEVLSFVKASYRILWDIAATESDEKKCLNLRKNAILALLLRSSHHVNQSSHNTDLYLGEKYGHLALSWAWKAAVSYVQQRKVSSTSSDHSNLLYFYSTCDKVFEEIYHSSIDKPISYFEFNIHQVLHIGIEPNQLLSKCNLGKEFSFGNVIFCIVVMVTSFKSSFESLESGQFHISTLNHFTSTKSLLDFSEGVFDAFLKTLPSCQVDDLHRYYKLLMQCSLSRRISGLKQVLNEATYVETISAVNIVVLDTVCRIETECIVVLIKALIKAEQNSENEEYWQRLVESYSQVILLYEILHAKQGTTEKSELNVRWIEKCDIVIVEVSELLLLKDKELSKPPASVIERFSKLLFSVGKRRNESLGIALERAKLPLVYSLNLFTKLEGTSRNLEFSRSCQLGMRYSYVASLLQNYEAYTVAGKLALVASLTFHAAIRAIENGYDDPFSNLLCFIMETSRGTKISSLESTSISLLIRLMSMKSKEPEEYNDAVKLRPSLQSLSNCITAIVLDKVMPMPSKADILTISKMKIEDLLISAFSDLLSRCPTEKRGALVVEQGKISTLLTMRTGLAMQGNGISEKEYANLRSEFNFLPRLLVRLLKNASGSCEGINTNFLEGVSYNIAAAAFISRLTGEDVNKQVEYLREMLLSRAAKAFAQHSDEAQSETKISMLVKAILVEITYRQKERLTREAELLEQTKGVVKIFLTTPFTVEDQILAGASLSIQAVLLGLYSRFISNGDTLQAAKLVHWNFALSQKWGNDEALKHWYAAKVMSSLTEGNFLPFANRLSREKYSPHLLASEITNLMTIDFWVASLRLEMDSVDQDKLHNVLNELLRIQDMLRDDSKLCRKNNFEWLYLWVNSSVSAAFCDLFTKLHKPSLALANSKECIKTCQRFERLFSSRDLGIDWLMHSVLGLFSTRRLKCLQQASFIYNHLGYYRKSEAYLLSALEQVDLRIPAKNLTELSLVGTFAQNVRTTQQMKCYHSLLSLLFRLSRFDMVKPENFSIIQSLGLKNVPVDSNSEPGLDLDINLECLRIVNTYLYDMAQMKWNKPLSIDNDFRDAISLSEQLEMKFLTRINSSFFLGSNESLNIETLSETVAMSKLNLVESLLSKSCESSVCEARSICNALMARKETLSPFLKARTYYYLGLMDLQSGRISGTLEKLWNEIGGQCKVLRQACANFEKALILTTEQQNTLKREICRSLALSLGPELQSPKLGLSADTLIHFSIGSIARKKFIKVTLEKDDQNSKSLRDIFNMMEIRSGDKVIHVAEKLIPNHWRIVAAALCPTGELLLSSLKEGVRKCACVFPSRMPNEIFDSSIYNNMMVPLDTLIHQSECQLNAKDGSKLTSDSTEDSTKRDWWNRRKELDDGLKNHLRHTESLYFDDTHVKGIFGESISKQDYHDEEHSPRGNLESKFDAAASINDLDCDKDLVNYKSLQKLTVVQLKDELRRRDISFSSRLRKADLIDLLVAESADQTPIRKFSEKARSETESIVLFLDENLHRFSFEGLPFLLKRPITRMHSLLFLLASQVIQPSNFLNARTTRFVLDPESNLGKTTERIMPFIESLKARGNDWDWSGVVGRPPSTKFVQESITKRESLFLYCGHGGGEGSFSQKDIESLVQCSDTSMPCKASIVLMGCSSGKLMSVNRKNADMCEQAVIHFEPEGIALSYLSAGSPCIVGNLWDVTDRDIDRYSLALMNNFINQESNSTIAQSVADARSSCKMKYIVGLAPVCYGVPVAVKTVHEARNL